MATSCIMNYALLSPHTIKHNFKIWNFWGSNAPLVRPRHRHFQLGISASVAPKEEGVNAPLSKKASIGDNIVRTTTTRKTVENALCLETLEQVSCSKGGKPFLEIEKGWELQDILHFSDQSSSDLRGKEESLSSESSSATQSEMQEVIINKNRVTVQDRTQKLCIYFNGSFELRKKKDLEELLVACGQVELPTELHSPDHWQVKRLGGNGGAVEIKWSNAAVLRILCAGEDLSLLHSEGFSNHRLHDPLWASKLEEGFVCEFTVDNAATDVEMAEVVLDMRISGHWFGGGHFMRQHWPLNLGEFEVGPFFPFDNGPNGTNTLLSPQWMTSKGLLVLANPDTPYFHVGLNAPQMGPHDGWIQRTWGVGVQNLSREYLPYESRGTGDGKLRLQARSTYRCKEMLHPLRDWAPHGHLEHHDTRTISLQFALCAHRNVKEASMAALKTLNRPPNPPPKAMVDAPIWTTWARYHAKVDQVKVERFANEIVARGLQRSVMEIDDKWQSKYGDFQFDPVKFPQPRAMVELLHALGFKVTLWIMPFAEENSNAYREGAPKGYFIKSDSPATRKLKPGFFHWWQPVPAAALDVTNPEAVDWFVGRLRKLQEDYLIDGFKFDAGEPCFLPTRFRTHTPIPSPTEYTRLYVQEVASKFDYSEVRTGHKTNDVPLLTRMGDRFSTWSSSNGLRSIIPTLLTSGLLGYPFCLPDMIGGNAYFGRKPDVELMVRWAQANALMPAMQFSIAPWDLSAEADKLCKAVLDLRAEVTAYIFSVMEETCKVLAPVCRPMWWLDPDDPETFLIGDQFVIGDDIIVAPVVVKGQKKRDVYLPRGTWTELLNPTVQHEGPVWLRDTDAPLHKIPIYRRLHPSPSPFSLPQNDTSESLLSTIISSTAVSPGALQLADIGESEQTVAC